MTCYVLSAIGAGKPTPVGNHVEPVKKTRKGFAGLLGGGQEGVDIPEF